jgi:hypothetical protein
MPLRQREEIQEMLRCAEGLISSLLIAQCRLTSCPDALHRRPCEVVSSLPGLAKSKGRGRAQLEKQRAASACGPRHSTLS